MFGIRNPFKKSEEEQIAKLKKQVVDSIDMCEKFYEFGEIELMKSLANVIVEAYVDLKDEQNQKIAEDFKNVLESRNPKLITQALNALKETMPKL